MKTWLTCCLVALASAAACADEAASPAELRQRAQIAADRENLRKQHAAIDNMQREQDAVRAAAQKACGADFGVPRVGMTLDRAKQCIGHARLTGQVNRRDGVASIYTNDRVQLIVMENKVVAWQGLR